MTQRSYRRLLLKLSGESLKGDSSSHIQPAAMDRLVSHVSQACQFGVQIALVVGAGNILRGKDLAKTLAHCGLNRADSDYMGMMATVMNAIAVKAALEKEGHRCRVVSALAMPNLCDVYHRGNCLASLESGEVLIFAGGTGNPFFTTDTAATLRALEMQCDALVKLTKVDGVYDKDPNTHLDAKRFDRLTFQEVLLNRYAVMDSTAIALAQEEGLPILVGGFESDQIIKDLLEGRGSLTTIEKG